MRALGLVGLVVVLAGFAMAKPGHAEASWHAEGPVPADGVLKTAVRMVIEEGWHVYWLNPGEAGMPVQASWSLPDGWSAGPLEHPMPVRFTTGELHGFGHVGEVWFPLTLQVPSAHRGPVVLEGELAWLACNDASCVPGKQGLRLELGGDAACAGEVLAAHRQGAVPAPDSVALDVRQDDGRLTLRLTTDPAVRLVAAESFVATPDVVDPAVAVRFEASGAGVWVAQAMANEYADGPLRALELWIPVVGQERPWVVRWQQGAE